MKLFAYPLNIENTIPIPYPLLPMPSFYEIDLHVAIVRRYMVLDTIQWLDIYNTIAAILVCLKENKIHLHLHHN
jgi:hypothetical protein